MQTFYHSAIFICIFALLEQYNGVVLFVDVAEYIAKISDVDVEDAFTTSYPDAVLTQFEIRPEAVIAAAKCAADESVPLFVDA